MYMSIDVWVFDTDSGTVSCDFNDIDICGYRDESEGKVGWTRYRDDGKFYHSIHLPNTI